MLHLISPSQSKEGVHAEGKINCYLLIVITGELTANVHGPSEKIPVTIDARGDGKHTVIFTPKEQGTLYSTKIA